jgi:peptide/nickel transport system permease protein
MRVDPVFRLIATRLLFSIISLFAVSVIVFSSVELLPGDTAERILGREATKDSLAALRAKLHLEDPALVRYGRWFGGLVQGDFGRSLVADRPVLPYIASYFERTLLLGGFALLIHIPLSIGLGLLAAAKRDGPFDIGMSTLVLIGMSVPEFTVAIFLVMLFANSLGWFPPLALIDQADGFWSALYLLILPAVTLNLAMTAYVVRQTRGSMIETLRSDYIRMATLRGLSPLRILFVHALPNALGPAINAIALNTSWLVGGIVVVEVVFNYPGLGRLLVESIRFHDIPMIQGAALVLAGVYIAVNLVADVLTLLLNPKLRTRTA